MKDGWDSNAWDENWEEEFFTPEEKLREHAARSLDCDPVPGYGLDDMRDVIPAIKSEEEQAYERRRKLSRGRLRSQYRVFTKEEAAKLKI